MAPAILAFSDDAGLLGQSTAGARALGAVAGWRRRRLPPRGRTTPIRTRGRAPAALRRGPPARRTHGSSSSARRGWAWRWRRGWRSAGGPAYAAWAQAVGLDPSTGVVTASCMLFAGTGVAEYRFERERAVLSVGEGVFEADRTASPDADARRAARAAARLGRDCGAQRGEARPRRGPRAQQGGRRLRQGRREPRGPRAGADARGRCSAGRPPARGRSPPNETGSPTGSVSPA